jgi:microcin C transport system permease protein
MAISRAHALRHYILRRLLLIVPTLLGITFLVFLLCQFVPGGPIDQMKMRIAGAADVGEVGAGMSQRVSSIEIPEEDLASLQRYYGFDRPILVRYGLYLAKLATLDLGDSFRYTMPVEDLIVSRLPVSVYFGAIAFLLTYSVCIPLGILKALRHKSQFDNLTSVLIFLGYAIPGYALGAVLLALFAVHRDWFPLGGFESQGFVDLSLMGKIQDRLHHTALPVFCYAIHLFAFMTILMKNSLLENMGADYVKTALAKGMTWKRSVFVHALRNSLIPIATSFGNNISLILTGSLLIERVFGIPGMGLLFFEAITARDYPVVMGYIFISSALLLVGNLLSDLCVAGVDPRVRFGE